MFNAYFLHRFTFVLLIAVIFVITLPKTSAEDLNTSAATYVDVFLDEEANCQTRDSQHVSVRNTHPTKTVRVWLERYYRGQLTGDRSRTDLKPNADPDGLGCATISGGRQEWRIVKAVFVD